MQNNTPVSNKDHDVMYLSEEADIIGHNYYIYRLSCPSKITLERYEFNISINDDVYPLIIINNCQYKPYAVERGFFCDTICLVTLAVKVLRGYYQI